MVNAPGTGVADDKVVQPTLSLSRVPTLLDDRWFLTVDRTNPNSIAFSCVATARERECADRARDHLLLLPSTADVGKPVDDLQWSALLRSASGFEAYRRTCGLVSRESMVAFLLFDRAFPRSVSYCVTQAQASLHGVTGTPMRRFANRAEQWLGRLASELDYTDAGEAISEGLHEFIDALQDRFNRVGDTITATFFRQG